MGELTPMSLYFQAESAQNSRYNGLFRGLMAQPLEELQEKCRDMNQIFRDTGAGTDSERLEITKIYTAALSCLTLLKETRNGFEDESSPTSTQQDPEPARLPPLPATTERFFRTLDYANLAAVNPYGPENYHVLQQRIGSSLVANRFILSYRTEHETLRPIVEMRPDLPLGIHEELLEIVKDVLVPYRWDDREHSLWLYQLDRESPPRTLEALFAKAYQITCETTSACYSLMRQIRKHLIEPMFPRSNMSLVDIRKSITDTIPRLTGISGATVYNLVRGAILQIVDPEFNDTLSLYLLKRDWCATDIFSSGFGFEDFVTNYSYATTPIKSDARSKELIMEAMYGVSLPSELNEYYKKQLAENGTYRIVRIKAEKCIICAVFGHLNQVPRHVDHAPTDCRLYRKLQEYVKTSDVDTNPCVGPPRRKSGPRKSKGNGNKNGPRPRQKRDSGA